MYTHAGLINPYIIVDGTDVETEGTWLTSDGKPFALDDNVFEDAGLDEDCLIVADFGSNRTGLEDAHCSDIIPMSALCEAESMFTAINDHISLMQI